MRREDGNVLVIFAILLPLFIMACAIAIDVGYWWVNGKKAQIAADACALAAAQELPQTYADVENCMISGRDYVLDNLPVQDAIDPEPRHLGTRVRSPYEADASMVEATVRLRVQTFFGHFIGIDYVDLTRRAVAEKQVGETKLAIYAHSTNCDEGLEFNGLNISIDGHLHSNGEYFVNSGHSPDNFWARSGTIAKENCTAKLDPTPDGAAYGDGVPPDFLPEDGSEITWPTWFTPGQFGYHLAAQTPATTGRCTYKGLKIEITSNQVKITAPDQTINYTGPIPTGTYCATESATIGATGSAGNPVRGNITLLAPEIRVNGNYVDFSPHQQGMLFFTVPNNNFDTTDDDQYGPMGNPLSSPPYEPCSPSPSKEMILDGNHYVWAGTIFNPCGRVILNNNDSTIGNTDLVGTIYGFQVKINGAGFDMLGEDPFENSGLVALVE